MISRASEIAFLVGSTTALLMLWVSKTSWDTGLELGDSLGNRIGGCDGSAESRRGEDDGAEVHIGVEEVGR